jgi:exportin-7
MDSGQLSHIESLCEALYNGTSQEARSEAQSQLLTLQSSADFIPQCQFILDNSTQPYAQLLASSSLESIITQFWNNFSSEQKLEMRNYILSFLGSNSHTLMDFVVGVLSKLACRITKLGWFDHADHREIVKEVMVFLQGTVDQHIVGLRVLMNLVEEMNIPTTGRTMTHHRKTAVSFRDNSLFPVFQLAITTLQHLQSGNFSGMTDAQNKKMTTYALSVTTACLSFDFIGTNPEESPEDIGTVQVPSSWRSIVQDTTHMQLLFEFYSNTAPPMSNLALESIVQLSSVRRSLFSGEKERIDFLNFLMKNVHSIMLEKKGLEHVENYHEFCRLLGRLKASYQLSELVRTPGFSDWLGLAVDFTIKSLENWEMSMNSIHYLLALWGRLVAALPYLKPEANDGQVFSQFLRQCVMQVVQSYIDIMLSSVDVVVESEGGVEDPLEDEGSLKEQMDRFPVLVRLQFDTVAQYLVTKCEETIGQYQGILGSLQGAVSDQMAQQILVLEGRLTWLTHMIAAIVGCQSHSDNKKPGDDQLWDGQMSRYVFQLVQLIDYRLENSQGQAKCDIKLENAILTFFTSFKRVYLLDNFSRDSMMPINIGSTQPGASMAHPMLAAALSGLDPPEQENMTVSTCFPNFMMI